MTYYLPTWLLVLLIAEIVALYPILEPHFEKLWAKAADGRQRLEAAVLKLYKKIPRYTRVIG